MASDQGSDCSVCMYVSSHGLVEVLYLLQCENYCSCKFVIQSHTCMNVPVHMCNAISTKQKVVQPYGYKKDCRTYIVGIHILL